MTDRPVLVLGAGLAGLVCADLLVRAGNDVRVIEARTEPGGRVRTLRDFDDGLHAEAGAARIPAEHRRVRALVSRFGLSLVPFRRRPPVMHARGQTFASDDDAAIARAFAFTADEAALGARAIAARIHAMAHDALGDPTAAGWPPPSLDRLDAMSGSELVSSMGYSDGVIAWLGAGAAVLGLHGSALQILREMVVTRWGRGADRIVGGNDLLPRALAEPLGHRIEYGTIVRRIECAPDEVRVTVEARGAHREISADRVVVTLPFPVLREIPINPPLASGKARAIAELHYSSCCRVYVQTRDRPWDRGGNGFVTTDDGMDVFDASEARPGPRGLLLCYLRDEAAREVAALDAAERDARIIATLDGIFPGVGAAAERTAFWNWDADPFARGSLADFTPGQMRSHLPHIAHAEGRLYFAGEHTSPWAGWMEGAVESGERVAAELY